MNCNTYDVIRISFERQSSQDCEERIKQLSVAISEDTKALARFEKERDTLLGNQKQGDASIEKNKESLALAKEEAKVTLEHLGLCKKEMDAFNKKFEVQSKDIASKVLII
jgi:hypothetical protein